MSKIEEYGKKILTKEIKNERIVGYLKNYNTFNMDTLNEIVNEINKFNLNDVTYYLKNKVHNVDDQMKWHVDDAIVMNVPSNNNYDDVKISENKQLVYHSQKPIYTLIIYESNYKDDFTGGELEFVDGYKFKPKKGAYIFFNSCEVHKLNKINSGMRKSILIKFYK